jgi:hypothetical protein
MAMTKIGNMMEKWWSNVHEGKPATTKIGRMIENWWANVTNQSKTADAGPTVPAADTNILPEGGADPYAAYLQRKRRSGRSQTILTGSLSPTQTGQRTLLG